MVEDILAQRHEGATYVTIANGLNDSDVPTAQGGKQWYPATVRKVVATYDQGD